MDRRLLDQRFNPAMAPADMPAESWPTYAAAWQTLFDVYAAAYRPTPAQMEWMDRHGADAGARITAGFAEDFAIAMLERRAALFGVEPKP